MPLPASIPPLYAAAMSRVGDIWDTLRVAESLLPGWLGYGYGGRGHQSVIGLFVSPDADLRLLKTITQKVSQMVPVDFLVTRHFEAVPGARLRSTDHSIRPGAGVFSTSSLCNDADVGTIGTILRPRNAAGERWILSNNHVLARRCARLGGAGDPLKVELDSNEEVISEQIQTVAIQQTGNLFDACAARLLDPNRAVPDYGPLPLADPHPVRPLVGQPVQKLGARTNLTKANVEFVGVRAVIDLPSSGFFGAELLDQILVSLNQTDGAPFFQPGDSGSLVVHPSTKRPVGVLVGGGIAQGNRQFTVVSPLDTILGSVQPNPTDVFDLVLP